MSGKLTKAQRRWLEYLCKPHTGGRAELSGMRDLEMADRLSEKGLARIYEMRPGFYSLHITPAGRALLTDTQQGAET